MKITFNTNNMKGEIALGEEDANVEDCVDAFVGAMIAEGYDASNIAEAMETNRNIFIKVQTSIAN